MLREQAGRREEHMHGEVAYPGRPYEDREDEWRRARRRWRAMMAGAKRHGGHRGHHGRRRFGPGFEAWGAGRFPGPFFGRGPKVGRGDVRAAILVLLGEGPMHGYQIIQELTERSGGVWRPSPGSVYPTLQLLEDEGLIRSEETEGRRVFQLTDAGKAEVAKRGEDAPRPWEAFGDAGALIDLREVGFGVFAAVMQVAQTGNERQIQRAKEILSETRKSLYRLLAEDETKD
jgi:DNA-binding PadR family transcriptional regulator